MENNDTLVSIRGYIFGINEYRVFISSEHRLVKTRLPQLAIVTASELLDCRWEQMLVSLRCDPDLSGDSGKSYESIF